MTNRISKTILLAGVAMLAVTACASEKGPGAIGNKNDIVVKNNGLPGAPVTGGPAQQAAQAQTGDFSSAVEQGEAAPPPSVEQAQTVGEPAPQVDAASQQLAEANAPVASTTNAPINSTGEAGSTSPTVASPIETPIPEQPVTSSQAAPAASGTTQPRPMADVPSMTPTREGQTYVPPSAQAAPQTQAAQPQPEAEQSSVYAQDTASAQQSQAPSAPQPVRAEPAPAGTGAYKMTNPNAPYSPRAAASAGAVTTTVVPEPDTGISNAAQTASPESAGSGSLMADPASVRSAQQALATQGLYKGPTSGAVNADFLNALSLYQGMNKLPQGGLNAETMQSLSSGGQQPQENSSVPAPTSSAPQPAAQDASQGTYGGY